MTGGLSSLPNGRGSRLDEAWDAKGKSPSRWNSVGDDRTGASDEALDLLT